MNDIKEYYEKNKKIIFYSLDFAFLIIGLLFYVLGRYVSDQGVQINNVRLIIGGACIAVWYILFPFLESEKKDKMIYIFAAHVFFVVTTIVVGCLLISYIQNNREEGKIIYDVLFCVGSLFVITYYLYIFLGFVRTSLKIIKKVKSYIFPKLKETQSSFINIIEGLTATVVSVSAFVGSIVGVVAVIKEFLG